MIDKELRGILLRRLKYDVFDIDEATTQIKALVVESLGEKKELYNTIPYEISYNQHIAEMKEKWG